MTKREKTLRKSEISRKLRVELKREEDKREDVQGGSKIMKEGAENNR